MSKLNTSSILYLASLSALVVSEAEKKDITKQLDETIKAITTISSFNTEGTIPTFQTSGNSNVFQTEKIGERVGNMPSTYTVTSHYYEK